MKIKYTIFLILLGCFLVQTSSYAQESQIRIFPQDQNLFTIENMVNKLIATGVKVTDIKTNFDSKSQVLGVFVDPARYMGIGQGIVLSTGTVTDVTGDNDEENYTSSEIDSVMLDRLLHSDSALADTAGVMEVLSKPGDPDLSNEIGGLETYDARIVELQFIPSADTLYYRYIFASEEYEEYVCSDFNDVFAFYLSDAGSLHKRNIALVPGTHLPVSINTVNNGNPDSANCVPSNPHLFHLNTGRQHLLFDGFTKVLEVREKVIPGKAYKLKIAIADASDAVWDSAVFIENGSMFSYFRSYEVPFEKNSSSFDTAQLAMVITELKKYPDSKIQLIGHSDRPGTVIYNYELSVKRVQLISAYLQANGVGQDRIIEVYKGEMMPKYEEDKKNRLVELFIMGA